MTTETKNERATVSRSTGIPSAIPRTFRRAAVGLAGLLLGAAVLAGPARADAVADFYKGRSVTIVVGYGPGGGYDTTARLLAQAFGKHVPGSPSVIVQNAPGGGGLKVANTLYNVTAKDGLTLGVFSSDIALEPLYGNKEAHFEVEKFAWVGSIDTDLQACGVWRGAGAGIKTLPALIAAKKTVAFGSSSPAADTSLYPLFFKNALGAPAKVINGYQGTKPILLAMQRGEVDATCGLFESSIRGSYMSDVQSGNLNLFVQVAMNETSPLFGQATPIANVLKTEEMRKVAELVFGPSQITRPLAAPPGTPKDRVAALRAALMDSMKDPTLIAAGAKMKLTLKPMTGDEVEAMFAKFRATPTELVKKAFAYTHE